MGARMVFIRDNGGEPPFRAVVKPHPGVGQSAGNVFGIATHPEAVTVAERLAERWSCGIEDET